MSSFRFTGESRSQAPCEKHECEPCSHIHVVSSVKHFLSVAAPLCSQKTQSEGASAAFHQRNRNQTSRSRGLDGMAGAMLDTLPVCGQCHPVGLPALQSSSIRVQPCPAPVAPQGQGVRGAKWEMGRPSTDRPGRPPAPAELQELGPGTLTRVSPSFTSSGREPRQQDQWTHRGHTLIWKERGGAEEGP